MKRVCDKCVPEVREKLKDGATIDTVSEDASKTYDADERKMSISELGASFPSAGDPEGKGDTAGLLASSSPTPAEGSRAAAAPKMLSPDEEEDVIADSLENAGF